MLHAVPGNVTRARSMCFDYIGTNSRMNMFLMSAAGVGGVPAGAKRYGRQSSRA